MKRIISILSFVFSLLAFLVGLAFFLKGIIEYYLLDPQYVLMPINNKGFYWRLAILILSFMALLFNTLSLIVKKERLFKTPEERKQASDARRKKRIMKLNAKIEKLKNEDDE